MIAARSEDTMQERVARLETSVQHMQADIAEIKGDLRVMRADIADVKSALLSTRVWFLVTGLSIVGALTAVMARGFKWI